MAEGALRVALLRGVNVGGHRKVPMADLRALCVELGFGDVRSHVQSGNLVFTATGARADVEARLEAGIEARFGFPVDVMVVDAPDWRRLIDQNPLPEAASEAPRHYYVGVLKAPPAPGAAERLEAKGQAGEVVRAVGGVLYLHFPLGAGRSKLGNVDAKVVGSPGTLRNWNTVLALQALIDAVP